MRLFAAAIMIMIGMFHLIAGFAAVLRGSYFVVSENYFLVIDVAVWGWGHLVLGIIVVATGAALFAERPWAYVSGIVIVGLSALGNFMFLPYQPLWAVLIIAVDVAVVWALAMRLRELSVGD
ncbi:DUF7144 family membrane protein [Stackebrandtia nassauensis]|uniref:DUF7144 family membrane protein n=1 Tax=Stackebrandtia nassauensis TaxID=283811 RepID=UPI001B7FD9BC|nr:hypothetical protein [Stackebrandtia nassauensis]